MGWSEPQTWPVGGDLLSTEFNREFRDNLRLVPHYVAKAADESVASSVTMQDDDHLLFAMEANAVYSVETILRVLSASTTPDFKMQYTFPSGTTFNITSHHTGSAGSFLEARLSEVSSVTDLEVLTTGTVMAQHGVVACGGTPGNFQVQWAQQTSNATPTVLKKGSCIFWAKVA